MADPAENLQKGVFAALTASEALADAMGGVARVYDKVVPDPTYPFIRIGDDDISDDSDGCSDGWEARVKVHIFSRDVRGPRMQVKRIAAAVAGALVTEPPSLTVATFTVYDCRFVNSTTWFEDNDGVTAHGVSQFDVDLR